MEKLQYLEEKVVLVVLVHYFIHHISHVDWPGIKSKLPHGEMSNQLPVPWHRQLVTQME